MRLLGLLIWLWVGAGGTVRAQWLDLEAWVERVVSNVDLQAVAKAVGTEEGQLVNWLRQVAREYEFAPELLWEPVADDEEWELLWPPLAVPPLELPVPPPSVEPAAPQPFWRRPVEPQTWPARAHVWVPQLKPIFESEGVPAELVWIAEVESNFQPTARSRAGAAGLYQLMPATAEWLGLALTPHDERLDPIRNARASARYLQYLWRKFGCWQLTMAAYNGGEGRVRRLLGDRWRTFAEIESQLPLETQLYVSRVQATLLEREGMLLGELRSPRAARSVVVNSGAVQRTPK